MIRKKGLGKGLGALIPEEILDEGLEKSTEGLVQDIDMGRIQARADQPRKEFDETSLRDLQSSIESFGILQPIVVRKKGDYYEIIAGERRFRACQLAGLKSIPAIVKKVEDQAVMELSLVENIQRENLNPIEEARAYRSIMDQYHLTQESLSKRIGKSRTYLANILRLLQLDENSMHFLETGEITSSQGRSLLAIKDLKERQAFLDKLLQKNANIRDIEKAARKKTKAKRIDFFQEEMEQNFTEALGTKVKLIPKKMGGKIEIDYYNYDDLERILKLIK